MSAKSVLILCLIAALSAVNCSDDKITAPTESKLASVTPEMFPLEQGAIWNYNLYMMESSRQVFSYGEQLTNHRSYGRLEITVPYEAGSAFTCSWHVNTRLVIDSVRTEKYLDMQLKRTTVQVKPQTYSSAFSILVDCDTLWYYEDGSFSYMMPCRCMPGGTINLKIFNVPDTDFFLRPIAFDAQWSGQFMLYQNRDSVGMETVMISSNNGVMEMYATRREAYGEQSENYRQSELHYTLSGSGAPFLASLPGLN